MQFRYCTAKSVFKAQIWAKNILQRFDEKLLYLSDCFCVVHKEEEIAIHTEQQRSITPENGTSEYNEDDLQHKKHSVSLTSPLRQATRTEPFQLITNSSLHSVMDIYSFLSLKSVFQHCPRMTGLCRGQSKIEIMTNISTRALFVETEYFPRLALN